MDKPHLDHPSFTPDMASHRLQSGFYLIFALLGVLLTGWIATYWFVMVEPLMLDDAAGRSRALAQAQALHLEHLVSSPCEQADTKVELQTALSTMLLLKDPSTGTRFIQRISLQLDYDLVPGPAGRLDIAVGAAACQACFVSEIPLYHLKDHQLIGVVTFHSSPEFLLFLLSSIRTKLLWVGLGSLGLIGMAILGTRHLLQRLKVVEAQLHQAALTDALTGVANRRALYGRLMTEVERAQRYPDQPCSVILIDLDHFKQINDRFGHAMGDEVLRKVAATLLTVMRKTDLVGRYGGEEFLVVLPHTGWQEAMDAAERIRVAVKDLTWADPQVRLTVSGGVCECRGETPDALVRAADGKLYQAKEAGRDRMVG